MGAARPMRSREPLASLRAERFSKGPNLTQPVLMGVPLAALVAGTEMTTHR